MDESDYPRMYLPPGLSAHGPCPTHILACHFEYSLLITLMTFALTLLHSQYIKYLGAKKCEEI